jgi:hypothetical protein
LPLRLYPDSVAAIQLARLSGFYPIVTTASPSNEDLVRDYGATHFFDRHLSGNQLVAAISKVIDSPIRIVFGAISLPETQSVGWRLLVRNGVLVLTLPASVKDDEGKGRKAVYSNGNPHPSYNHKLFCDSWAMVEKWLLEGIIQVCCAITILHIYLCSRTTMKSFQMGLKVSLEVWKGWGWDRCLEQSWLLTLRKHSNLMHVLRLPT